jgi:hypothetical protein
VGCVRPHLALLYLTARVRDLPHRRVFFYYGASAPLLFGGRPEAFEPRRVLLLSGASSRQQLFGGRVAIPLEPRAQRVRRAGL